MDRRRLFQGLSGLLCAGYVAFLAIPGVKFLRAPLRDTRRATKRRRLTKVSDLEVGVPRKVVVVDQRNDAWTRYPAGPIGAVWLLRRDETNVEAFSATCPHLGCAVQHTADDEFFCPCHEAKFGKDGSVIAGPSRRGLDTLDVALESVDDETWVAVTFEKFQPGTPEKVSRG